MLSDRPDTKEARDALAARRRKRSSAAPATARSSLLRSGSSPAVTLLPPSNGRGTAARGGSLSALPLEENGTLYGNSVETLIGTRPTTSSMRNDSTRVTSVSTQPEKPKFEPSNSVSCTNHEDLEGNAQESSLQQQQHITSIFSAVKSIQDIDVGANENTNTLLRPAPIPRQPQPSPAIPLSETAAEETASAARPSTLPPHSPNEDDYVIRRKALTATKTSTTLAHSEAVTPARKAAASVAFSTAAAVASARRSNQGNDPSLRSWNSCAGDGHSLNFATDEDVALSPMRTIQGLLSSIPGHLSTATANGKTRSHTSMYLGDHQRSHSFSAQTSPSSLKVTAGSNQQVVGKDDDDIGRKNNFRHKEVKDSALNGELSNGAKSSFTDKDEGDDSLDSTHVFDGDGDWCDDDGTYTIDPSSIPIGCTIMIRSSSRNGPIYISAEEHLLSTSLLVNGSGMHHRPPQQHQQRRFIANAEGVGLSRPNECLVISLVAEQSGVAEVPFSKDNNHHNVIRYGDTVALYSTYAKGRALGVRKKVGGAKLGEKSDVPGGDRYEPGFFRTVLGQAEKWTILPSREGKVITVGPLIALSLSGTTSLAGTKKRAIVRSGEPIVLRNVFTGGLLSLTGSVPENELTIITSTYQMNQDLDVTKLKQSACSFIQNHHRVKLTVHETFQIIHVNVPPCPQWSLSKKSALERVYLNGDYLKVSCRNEISEKLEELLFCSQGGQLRSISKHNSVSRSRDIDQLILLGMQPIHAQEQIMLDELIGCMMGLEGTFINAYRTSSNGKKSLSFEASGISFCIAPLLTLGGSIDTSLANLAMRILPLCTDFVRVHSYVASRLTQYEQGFVTHALCGAMDVFVQEYLGFVVDMEDKYTSLGIKNGFTMSSLYASAEPFIRTMSVLSRIVCEVESTKGGNLLNKLQVLMTTCFLGDEKAQRIFQYLMDNASLPYMRMMRDWLERGALSDPYSEFMVEEALGIGGGYASSTFGFMSNDEDWWNWYGVRQQHVLISLTSHDLRSISVGSSTWSGTDETVRKIVTTGKYLNAIAYCREQGKLDHIDHLTSLSAKKIGASETSSFRSDLSSFVDRSYAAASKTLLNIVLRDHHLVPTLRFMKRYFLFDQGDFFVHFLDMAEDELLQEMPDVSRGRVQSWMNTSVQLSSITWNLDNRPCNALSRHGTTGTMRSTTQATNSVLAIASSLKCDFATQSLVDHLDALHATSGGISSQEQRTPSRHVYGGANRGLTGVEAFMLDFSHVPFPISLVLSKHVITNYQLLFRHLFFAKHVERRLVGTWLDHQMIKEFQTLRKDLGPTYCLRQRMLHFMQNFVYYMMFEVIEPNWLSMESAILQSKDKKAIEEFEWTGRRGALQTIDDVLRIHQDFIRRTVKECLLTDKDLIRTLTKLMTTCLLFSDQMKLFMETAQIDQEQNKIAMEARQRRQQSMFEGLDGSATTSKKRVKQITAAAHSERRARKQKQVERLHRELKTESYRRMINRFEQVFNSNLAEFMSQLLSDSDGKYHSHLSNLGTRLDYNGYVTRFIKK